VSLGEADAAVVYTTDVKAAKGDVGGVKIPDRQNVLATYPIGVVKRSQQSAGAKAWVRFLESKEARRTLQRFGFLLP
jgi:molybdate transport system substrate-binding protein